MTEMAQEFQELIDAMQEPSVYNHSLDGPIEVIHTAISVVFLAGAFAYKISKPVNFGFYDT